MVKKIAVTNLTAILYISFVASTTILVGILPAYVNLPKCEDSKNNLDVKIDSNDTEVYYSPSKQRILTDGEQNLIKRLEKALAEKNKFKNSSNLPYCSEINNPQPINYPWYDSRLPNNYYPLHYDLYLYVTLWGKRSLYDGDVDIKINFTKPTNYLMVHLAINGLPEFKDLTDKNGNSIEVECNGIFRRNDYYILKTKKNLAVEDGPYTLSLFFIASLSEFESGLFEFNFDAKNDEDPTILNSTMLASRFEPLDARKAFPCMDEPQLKATFNITIDHPLNTTALSNTGHISDEQTDKITTKFTVTEKMPTSLIGLVVFYDKDFKFVSQESNSGIPIKIWARKHFVDENQTDIALEMTVKIFNALENLLRDVSNKKLTSKIDVFTIPEYPNDAIPHIGLPIFAENKILMLKESASQRNKQDAALLIAKQLAEFWFGNFVTFKWWDELWLQEALGDYIKYSAVNEAYPDFNIKEQFITEELVNVLIDDGYPSSHPIEKPVDNPNEIEEYFDSVERSKGAAILRMIAKEIGETAFFKAITSYLNENAWDSGDYVTFASQFGNINSWNAKEFFDRWIKQANYPVVFIDLIKTGTNRYNISLKQDRHMNSKSSIFSGDLLYPSDYNFVWYIPLECNFGYTDQGADQVYQQTFYLETKEASFQVNLQHEYKWVHCDRDFSGYYLTSYKNSNWEALALALKNSKQNFDAEDRASIIHHALIEGYTDRTTYSEVVQVLSYLTNEKEYLPWRTVYHHVEYLAKVLDYSKSFLPLSRFFITELSKLERDELWESTDTPVEELLRETILEISCRLQDTYCINKVAEFWPNTSTFSPNNTIPPFIRSIVYNYHFQNTYDVKDWKLFFQFYALQNDILEQERYFKALTFTRLPWLLSELIESLDYVKSLDFFDLFKYISKQPIGREFAWGYLRYNYRNLENEYKNDPRLGQLLLDICSSFEDEFMLIQLLEFVRYTPIDSTKNARFKAIEIASTNFIWLLDNENELFNSFSSFGIVMPREFKSDRRDNRSPEEIKLKLNELYDKYKIDHIFSKDASY